MKKYIKCFICLFIVGAVSLLVSCQKIYQSDVDTSSEIINSAENMLEPSSLPSIIGGSYRKDAKFMSLEEAQLSPLLLDWLPKDNPFPERNNLIIYNEKLDYVNVVFYTENPQKTIHISLSPNQLVTKDDYNTDNLQTMIQKSEIGATLDVDLIQKSASIYADYDESAEDLLRCAEWLLK